MAKLEVVIDTPAWIEMIRNKEQPVAIAASQALQQTAANAVQEGRQQIATSGRGFTRRWITGLQYRMQTAESLNAQAVVFHNVGLATVFEFGATIAGRPLLWIPTRYELRNTPPRRLIRSGVKLVAATVRGQPMLFNAADRDRHRKPLYIGVPSVRIPKLWHITEIVEKHVAGFMSLFRSIFKDN